MIKTITQCDICKSEFNSEFENSKIIHIEKKFEYGSKFDDDNLSIDICEDCFEHMLLNFADLKIENYLTERKNNTINNIPDCLKFEDKIEPEISEEAIKLASEIMLKHFDK